MKKRYDIHKSCKQEILRRNDSKSKKFLLEIEECESPKFNESVPSLKRFSSFESLKINFSKPLEKVERNQNK